MKKKKTTKMRGKTSHGYGSKKKHRGAGSRGGRGFAGSGKRADQKKPTILKKYGSSYYGKKGFKRAKTLIKKEKTINLDSIQENIDKLAKKENDHYIFDARALGYTKILGKGAITIKIKIICNKFSKKAIDKIKKANGEAIWE